MYEGDIKEKIYIPSLKKGDIFSFWKNERLRQEGMPCLGRAYCAFLRYSNNDFYYKIVAIDEV